MAGDDLSLQLYTVRSELREDFDATLARIADIGYRRVEPFDLVAMADRLATALPARGLRAPTAHVALLQEDRGAVFAAARRLGVGTLIVPFVSPERWRTADDIRATARELNAAAAEAAGHGLSVGYHNHHFELESRVAGAHALEVLAGYLADEVILEVDTYWAAVGGADVPALLARLGDRVRALHVKDGDGTLDNKAQVAVGAGIMPVAAILAAAPAALRVVELDDFDGDMFEAVTTSFGYLEALG